MADGTGTSLDRRTFLRAGAVAGLGAGLLPVGSVRAATGGPPGVRGTAVLGRTGLRISDIGFGSSRLSGDEDLVRHALDRGITYFDTAESYQGGDSEETLGRALQGKRDQVVLTSKVKVGSRDRVDRLMGALEASLKRLQTDHVDIYFNHAVNDVARLQADEWGEFNERAKQQGKIRFVGVSGHGGRLVECLDYTLDHDQVDVVLVGYNFGQDPDFFSRLTKSLDFVSVQPDLPRVLAKAKAKSVGVVAMKTLRGARLNDLRPYEVGGATFAQSAFRWVLSSPNVDSLIVTMHSAEEVDEYLGASGWNRSAVGDAALLERYESLHGTTQCRYGCNACLDSCPRDVSIPDVLRARMYAEDYGDEAQARDEYARVGGTAEACATCASQACASACPFGLPIPELTLRTHRRLSG